jgi:hypothetical protein
MLLNQRICIIVAAAFVCGVVFFGRPVSAQTQIQAGQFIISELRLRGPAGAEDEFVELYNNTEQAITVQALDQSNGWSVVVSNGQITGTLFTVPNGTVIPARGHYLGANSNGYSLCNYPSGYGTTAPTPTPTASPCVQNGVGGTFTHTTPDQTWDFDVSDGSGVALFATTNGTNFTAATRLDAAGFTTSPALYREGNGIATVVTASAEHTYYRDLRSGTPRDTADNAADFMLVGTAPGIQITRLGAPGPENLASPIVNNATITPTLLDPSVSSAAPPNRVRSFTMEPNATFGTMLIRRTITNNTGDSISRLRFRVINTTTFGTPGSECGGTCADLRALTSQGGAATVNSQVVPVLGVRLEEPPEQPAGGGYNASLSADTITFATPLPDGLSINVEFKLGIERTGPFRFILNIEAQNGGESVITRPASSGVGTNGRTNDSRKGRLIVDTVQSPPSAAVTPGRPTAAPSAEPRNAYAPWFINLTPPSPQRTRAADDEADKEDEGKGKKSEEAPPSAQPTAEATEASAPDSTAAAADAQRRQPATARRNSHRKIPSAAKASRRGGQ